MDWIHCNNCTIQPLEEDGKKLYTTNCGHIYCEDCLLLPELKQCRICQSSYQTMPLSSKMSKEVEMYFRNPIDDFQKLLKVLQFQQSHRVRLATINQEKFKTYAPLVKENLYWKEEFKRLQKENASIREENERLNKIVLGYKRKIESLQHCANPGKIPIHTSVHSDYGFFENKTPKLMKPDIGIFSSENHCTVLKQQEKKPNFFIMSSAAGSEREMNLFNTSKLIKIPGPYRSSQTLASELSSPASSKPSISGLLSQKDQHFRRVKLPGDKTGPSPSTSAFRRLALSKLPTIFKKDNQASHKYSQYFNKQ